MRKYNKHFAITVIVFLCMTLTMVFGGCDKIEVTMETNLSYDSSKDFGLYWYGGKTNSDYVRSSAEISSDYFDPSKPTIIYFHGWKPNPGKDEMKNTKVECLVTSGDGTSIGLEVTDYASLIKAQGYNVGEFGWFAYSTNLFQLFKTIWVDFDGEHSMSCYFAREMASFFKNYKQDIRFMGHSYGAQMAVAVEYQLGKMSDQKIIKNDHILPTRITLADPYIGDVAILSDKEVLNKKVHNIGEEIGGRLPAELVSDCFEYLAKKNVVIDVYCGMTLAYDQYSAGDEIRYNSIKQKLYANSVWTILQGLVDEYGPAGKIHNLTRDWVFESLLCEEKVVDGVNFPTASLDTAKMAKMKGQQFESVCRVIDLKNETFTVLAPTK